LTGSGSHAATTVASVCRRTRRPVEALVLTGDEDLPAAFQAGRLTVTFLSLRAPSEAVGGEPGRWWDGDSPAAAWDRCWWLSSDQLALTDLGHLDDADFGGALAIGGAGGTLGEMLAAEHGRTWPTGLAGSDLPAMLAGGLLNLEGMGTVDFQLAYQTAVEVHWLPHPVALALALDGRIQETAPALCWRATERGGATASERAAIDWGRCGPDVLHWDGTAKPWNDPTVPGAQLWLRESTGWDDLGWEMHFRALEQDGPPAIVIHRASLGLRNESLVDDLCDGGFAVETQRGCEAEYPLAFPDEALGMVRCLGWSAHRTQLARTLSHRWAWQRFIQQSDAPWVLIAEDDSGPVGTATDLEALCGQAGGNHPWLVDMAGDTPAPEPTGAVPGFRPLSGAYCLNRKAARLLLEADFTRLGMAGPRWAERLGLGNYAVRNGKIIGITDGRSTSATETPGGISVTLSRRPNPNGGRPLAQGISNAEPTETSGNNRIHLFFNWFDCPNERRRMEYEAAAAGNLGVAAIDRIYWLVAPEAGNHPFANNGTTLRMRSGRPTFRDIVDAANGITDPSDINIHCNSDILLDDGIACLAQRFLGRTLLAIARHEVLTGILHHVPYSQDTWIWQGRVDFPVPPIPMGTRGCDNAIATAFHEAGYAVENPAFAIRTWHIHGTGFRTYGSEVVPFPIHHWIKPDPTWA
jgi:hypothetical protein